MATTASHLSRLALAVTTLLATVCAGLLLAAGAAQAETTCAKVAEPSGSDSAAGTAAAPFKTAQKLASSLSAGQTGCLRAGSYTNGSNGYVVSPPRGGNAGAPITIRSYPGERARLVGIVNVSKGVDNVTFSDLVFEGTGAMNTIKIYSAGVVVENSEITNAWRGLSCMMLGSNSGGGQALRTVVRGNTFHACGNPANGNKDHAIYASNLLEGEIVDNLFYDSAAYAIQLYPNAQSTRFAHNVIDGGSPSIRGGLVVGGDGSHASSNNVVEQNVIAYSQTYNVVASWESIKGSGNIARDNCLWSGKQGNLSNGGGLTATNNPTADPGFVDRTARDYRLKPGSPCLATVGYDTAAKLAGGAPAPQPTPAPQPAPTPDPTPAPTPEPEPEPTPTPTPAPEPAPAPAPKPTEPTPAPAPTEPTTKPKPRQHSGGSRTRRHDDRRARDSQLSRRERRARARARARQARARSARQRNS
jgi:hypothetical protein